MFEVASHQWIDLTDRGGRHGVTILTGDKRGSDKPNENTIGLTLLRTPGLSERGKLYPHQATQDWGRHEISFGLAVDPETGDLWESENGPATFDEVNHLPPGSNGGWNKIMGPDALDAEDVSDLFAFSGSTYVDPHEEEKVEFKDLPNRFPSVLSTDFRKEQGRYEDVDNLFAMYLLYHLGKYGVGVNAETKLLEIAKRKIPMAYPEAARLAGKSAKSDSDKYRRRAPFNPSGTVIAP